MSGSRRTRPAGPMILVLGVVSLFTGVLGAAVNTANAGGAMGPSGPAWHGKVKVDGQFSGLMSAEGGLFAVRLPSSGPSSRDEVVRVDPRTGRILATSVPLSGISTPQFAYGALWVLGWSNSGSGSATLTELSAANLHAIRSVTLSVGVYGERLLVGGANGQLWMSAFVGAKWCEVQRIVLHSGVTHTTKNVRIADGPCGGLALDATGQNLYVAAANGSYDVIDRITTSTERVVAQARFVAAANFYSMVAISSRLWVAGGYPGSNGVLMYFSTTNMKELAHSNVGEPSGGTLPVFGQFPVVDYSGGRIWVGSDALLACFDPTSSKVLAQVGQGPPIPIVTDSIEVIDGLVWANANFSAPDTGLVQLRPPRACFI